MSRPSPTLIAKLRERVPLLVLTGAGVSAESGLATFRGAGGLWEGLNPLDLATCEAFRTDPETVWRFYAWRRRAALAAAPNAAHHALAAFERVWPQFLLVTQNVDGLHERSGSRKLERLHGTLWRSRCIEEGTEFDDHRADLGQLPPRCACGALLRPGVVWFGEALPAEPWERAERAALSAGLVLVAGTSSLVQPAALLPGIARGSGAYVVEINPERTPLSDGVDERLAGRAGDVLPALLDAAGVPQERAG